MSRISLTYAAAALALAAALPACRTDRDREHRPSTTARGERGERFTLVAPADQTVRRGETNAMSVMVRRADVHAPVALRFEDLPKGVEIVEKDTTIEPGSNVARVTLYARPEADLVTGHAVKVTARVEDGPAVTEYFHVTVRMPH